MLGGEGGEVDFCVPSFADRHESANTRRPKCLFACPKSVECMWHRPARTETIASPSIYYDHAHQSATINRRSSPSAASAGDKPRPTLLRKERGGSRRSRRERKEGTPVT